MANDDDDETYNDNDLRHNKQKGRTTGDRTTGATQRIDRRHMLIAVVIEVVVSCRQTKNNAPAEQDWLVGPCDRRRRAQQQAAKENELTK